MTRANVHIFISDFKSIVRKPLLLSLLLFPVFVVLFLLIFYPVISHAAYPGETVSHGRYLGLTGITLISAIPFIYGLLFSFIHTKKHPSSRNYEGGARDPDTRSSLLTRLEVSAILSFITALAVIYLTNPVSTEGWLRGIYAALLLAINAPFIFLLTSCCRTGNKRRFVFSVISVILLLAVPSGLLLHHPWNYFVFFSPFYWVGWAWVITSPFESMMYGMISLAVTAAGIAIFYKVYKRNSSLVGS